MNEMPFLQLLPSSLPALKESWLAGLAAAPSCSDFECSQGSCLADKLRSLVCQWRLNGKRSGLFTEPGVFSSGLPATLALFCRSSLWLACLSFSHLAIILVSNYACALTNKFQTKTKGGRVGF